jgi:hypothetical protein
MGKSRLILGYSHGRPVRSCRLTSDYDFRRSLLGAAVIPQFLHS